MATISRLLIANRGEIACRIARSARDLGIVPIAVYTDVDAKALHVSACDDAIYLGEEGHGSPYLDVAKVVHAAVQARADAVHPGFGFLSERAEFASAVLAAGLLWVGPPPEVMALLGRKDAARQLAKQLGVPVIAGVESSERLPATPRLRARALDELAELASCVGFPLLIKAVAGGGGRGMRVVHQAEALRGELAIAAEEATAAFGDGTLLVERFVEHGRHIEVQVLADAFGVVLHLGERECSVQRRHQKIVEETPSPGVDPHLRDKLCAAAVRLMQGAGYVSAGTVEFLLDDETGEFYLLEVNTRLQVEHGVTELVTGLDLVALQLAIAQRKSLQMDQADVHFQGHAIEVRICAEDPVLGFAPQSGPVSHWQPPTGAGIRVDHGLHPIDRVPVHYDAMVAKVMAHGSDRAAAIGRLDRALCALQLHGVANNRAYLLQVLRTRAFAAGRTTTRFVADHPPALLDPEPLDLAALAVWRHGRALARRFRNNAWRPDVTVFELADGGRWQVALTAAGQVFHFGVEPLADPLLTRPPATPHRLAVVAVSGQPEAGRDCAVGSLTADIGAVRHHWSVFRAGETLYAQHGSGRQLSVTERSLLPEPARAVATAGGVVAIGAAVVTQVYVAPGDAVSADQPLLALEAMKMLTVLKSPRDGVVAAVYAAVGDAVAAGAVLVELQPQA